jgi:glycosyltransferase involved in cell wall biosynthesis
MKIAQIVCAWPPYAGGIVTSAAQIDRLLGTQHEIVSFSPANLKPWLKLGHGAFLPQLLGKLREFDYIYLHYPFFGTAEVVWFFKLFCRRPKLIIHYHMDVKNATTGKKILSVPSRLIRNSLFNQAETIVSSSLDYIKNSQIKKYYAAHPEKFREIPFGIDLQKFQPKNLNQPTDNKAVARARKIVHYINDKFIKKDRLDILFVGGLDEAHYFKGVDVLIKAFAALSKTPGLRPWHLIISGDGDLRPAYEKLSREYGLEKQIEFTGRLGDKLTRAYQNADLLVLPSINSNEAFGLVLIEAMACGAPVIASDLPGVRNVFTNHQEGLLVEPGKVEDLKKKLEFIFNNEELRRVMSLAARRLAAEKYDEIKMRDNLLKLFRPVTHS